MPTPPPPLIRRDLPPTPDARYVCERCGFTGNIAQIGEHWIRQNDHSPDQVPVIDDE